MKTTSLLFTGILSLAGLAPHGAQAALPADFPGMTVTTYDSNAVAPGNVFITVTETSSAVGYYSMILQNDGTPIWYQKGSLPQADLKVLADGDIHNSQYYHNLSWTGGGDVYHQIMDENFNLLETISTGNGYLPEVHDIEVLPNGNVLALSYYQTRMDLSRLVTGGYPNALVSGAVVQELNEQRNVVWQWRSWDHYTFQDFYGPVLNTFTADLNQVVDAFHLNAFTMDNDGNLLISAFTADVEKINRQTGAVMWRLGGWANQFTFVGEDPQVAATHFWGHNLNRLTNGDILIFCNGDQLGTRSSKVYEYKLDEVNKIATLVWSYTPATPIYTWHTGSAQRLPNGNTFIGWGGGANTPGSTNAQVPACTEVTPSGRVVYELKFNDRLVASYRAVRFVYPPETQSDQARLTEIATGNTYTCGDTGVTLQVNGGGGGYNAVSVTRDPYSPVYPLFNGKPPVILPVRVQIGETAISSLDATVTFDTASFNLTNPANVTIYYRPTVGAGLFLPQTTSYSSIDGTLSASLTLNAQANQLGEFTFGYPDIAEIPLPPILNAVVTYPGVQPLEVIAPLKAAPNEADVVNQTLPIWLSWSPAGFAAYYELQVSTTPDFASPVVDMPYQTDAEYVWSNAAPATLYYWRVGTVNDGGQGDWATNTFQTAAPFLQITAPNGGEAWRRGVSHFVQWKGDVSDNIIIGLYKAGVFLGNIISNSPNAAAYKWTISGSRAAGSDYSLKISSAKNPAVFTASSAPFSIVDLPAINSTSVVPHVNGSVDFAITANGAPTATILSSTDLTNWQTLVQVPVTNGVSGFTDTPGEARFYRVIVP
ncbi:MAG TPA: aryl-sulfate sulfotransferase [Verrucomicrobiae bacterium]|jgi:hypothetical protein|nr:aryl-sulfate sulfotransferase [Verrucomicrobiae bacterium]